MPSIGAYLEHFIANNGSDLYITVGTPPHMRSASDALEALDQNALTEEDVRDLIGQLLSPSAIDEFDSTLEFNSAINWEGRIRLRVNLFRQRQNTGAVIRRIRPEMPTTDELGLPAVYNTLALEKRGLVLIVGPTGSGKSTSMAAMVDFRNAHSTGHIVTVEDPIEYIHDHKSCIVTQRDVGIDTYSFGIALKNVLRQRPDVVVIGEIRDRDNMEHALMFSETGHLCIATLHAGNSVQALERIVNFFPEDKHTQVLLSLSLNLKGLLNQRLVRNVNGKRSAALEVMLNEGFIKNLIRDGKLREIHEQIGRSRDLGMMTFDQSLFDLTQSGVIQEEIAIAESDTPSNLKLLFTQASMSKRTGAPIPLAGTPDF
jgi:twitching motility protein PilU